MGRGGRVGDAYAEKAYREGKARIAVILPGRLWGTAMCRAHARCVERERRGGVTVAYRKHAGKVHDARCVERQQLVECHVSPCGHFLCMQLALPSTKTRVKHTAQDAREMRASRGHKTGKWRVGSCRRGPRAGGDGASEHARVQGTDTGGAHRKHQSHGRDTGCDETQRLVERSRVLCRFGRA